MDSFAEAFEAFKERHPEHVPEAVLKAAGSGWPEPAPETENVSFDDVADRIHTTNVIGSYSHE